MLQCVLQSFPVSIEVHSPLIGGARVRGAWHALASVVMVAGWSVVFSSCSTSVCLCAALTSCSLSVFFPFPSYPPLSVSPSLPPSCSIPPIPLPHSLSPPLQHPGCFLVVVISNPAYLLLRLEELRVFLCFFPDINVLVFLSWALRFARWD